MPTYCTNEEVNSLFGDISDEVPDEMFTIAIGNSVAWIEANLKRHYVPIPTTVPSALKTVAIYQLDDYIDSYLNSEAEEAELVKHQYVKHSHGRTYNQKRGRGRWRR